MKNDGGAPGLEPQATIDALLPRQRQLWVEGERVCVEKLLLQYPHLQQHRDAVLDLINHEIVLRTEMEGPPALEEYVERFPGYTTDLQVLFEVHRAMERQGEATISNVNGGLLRQIGPLPELPHFTFEEILGQGGMGVVYRATDLRLKRTVALKMIRAGGGAEDRQRFQSEAEAVAKLDHPHIVHIFDIGDYRGQPYFALEFLDGGSLTQLLGGEPQPTIFAARMVEILARAVHYAHGQGIIHRDLKPGNILLHRVKVMPEASAPPGFVVKNDAAYLPKVADFGLAKHVDPGNQASQTQTIVGTPNYMAPEQAGEFSMKIGPQADVYALGAILYEMITGRPPFRGTSTLETLDQVRKLDPVSPCRLQPRCPRDLETICLKCLKKDPAVRYATAKDLAEDLGRFLRREPIRARPTGTLEQFLLWCRRNPRVAALSASLLVVILLSLATVTWLWQRAARGEAIAYAHLYASQINLGQRLWQEFQCRRLDHLLDALRQPPSGQRDLRDFEWYYLNGLLHRDLAHIPGENCVAFSPDGKLLATSDSNHQLCLWSVDQLKAGKPLRQWPSHTKALTGVAFNPKGDLLLSGSTDRTAKLWRVADGSLATTLDGHSAEVTAVAWDAKEGVVATACRDGSIRLWEPDGALRLILEEHAGTVNEVAFSPDGKLLASAGNDGKVRLWDVATGEVVCLLEGHSGEVLTVAFAPDGLSLVSGGADRLLRQWLAKDGELLQTFPPLPHWIQQVAFRPDGKRLAVACFDHTIHIWETGPQTSGEPGPAQTLLRGHFDRVIDLAFHPTQNWLASVSKDHTVRIWDADRDPQVRIVELEKSVGCFALHPTESRAAVVSRGGRLYLCDPETGSCQTIATNVGQVDSIAFSADGSRLACACADGKIRLWRLPEGTEDGELTAHDGEVTAVAFDPKTHRLASGGKDGTIRFWDLQSRAQAGQAQSHKGAVSGLAFCGDGSWLISGGSNRSLQVWNVPGNRLETEVTDVGKPITGLAVAPDGVLVAVMGIDPVVDLWDWRRQKLVQSLEAHAGHVHCIAFSHSGARLVSGGADGNLKLWDLTTGQDLLTLKGHGREVVGVAFNKADDILVSVGNMPPPSHGQIRIWDSRPGRKAPPRD